MAAPHGAHVVRVRGPICGAYNIGIGHFDDDPARVLRAAAYLRRVQR
jgi:hypothetical protein